MKYILSLLHSAEEGFVLLHGMVWLDRWTRKKGRAILESRTRRNRRDLKLNWLFMSTDYGESQTHCISHL